MELNRKTVKTILLIIAFGIGGAWLLNNYGLVGKLLTTVWGLVFPFLLGLFLAFILNIPLRAIENHLFKNMRRRVKRPLCFALAILLILLLFTLLAVLIIPQLSSTIGLLVTNIPGYYSEIVKTLAPLEQYLPQLEEFLSGISIDWSSLSETLFSLITTGTGSFLGGAFNAAFSVINGVASFFIAIMFAAYVLLDKEHLAAQLKGLLQAYLPKRAYQKIIEVAQLVNTTYFRFIAGQFAEAAALFVVYFIALAIGRFEYGILIAVVISLGSFIPIIGAFVSCILGALLILISMGFWRALAFVIMFLVIQQLDGSLMYPRIVGTSIGLPALWVLFAVSLGGGLMGIFGMIFFIPLFSVIYTLLHRDARGRLEAKGIPSPVADLDKDHPVRQKKRKKWTKKK